MTVFEGRARRFGDDVNTDYIIASARKRATLDEAELTRYLFETIDPGFAASVQPGDILVAGRNFGCGSAMEIAATVILAAGIRTVIALSFSRTFFRNAINNGLLPIEGDTSGIQEKAMMQIALRPGGTDVAVDGHAAFTSAPLAPRVREIVDAGGIVAWLRGR